MRQTIPGLHSQGVHPVKEPFGASEALLYCEDSLYTLCSLVRLGNM